MRPLLIPIILTFAALAGCASYGVSVRNAETANNKESTRYRDPEFTHLDLREHGIAIGGLVLREGLALDKESGVDYEPQDLTVAVQVDLWTPVLDDVATRKLAPIEVLRWYSVQRSVPGDLGLKTQTRVSRRGTLMPDLLAEWSAHLPSVTYLAFVRVDETWRENSGQVGMSATTAMGRVVVLTMDVYDVKRGLSVWSHEVRKHVNPNALGSTDYSDDGDMVRRITTFDEALDDAIADAIGDLGNAGDVPAKQELGETDF